MAQQLCQQPCTLINPALFLRQSLTCAKDFFSCSMVTLYVPPSADLFSQMTAFSAAASAEFFCLQLASAGKTHHTSSPETLTKRY